MTFLGHRIVKLQDGYRTFQGKFTYLSQAKLSIFKSYQNLLNSIKN